MSTSVPQTQSRRSRHPMVTSRIIRALCLSAIAILSLFTEAAASDPPKSTTEPPFTVITGDELPTRQHASLTLVHYVCLTLAMLLLIAVLALHGARQRTLRNRSLLKQLAVFFRDRTRQLNSLELLPVTSIETAGWNRMVELMRDRNVAETALHTSSYCDSSLRSLVEELPDGIAWTDDDGRMVYANPILSELLSDFRLQQSCEPSQLPLNFAKDDGALATEHRRVLEQRLLSLIGSNPERLLRPGVETLTGFSSTGDRVLRVARQRRRTSSGSSPGMIWTIRDVTQQRLAERMRDEFLDSATHELRTPLANIKAYAETLVLSDQLEIAQQREFCNTINSEATRLARLIDDMLSISSMEVGGLSIDCRNTELDRLVRDVAANVRPSMESKKQNFNVVLGEKLSEMSLDADKFATVLVNLLGNASKYTPVGGSVTFRVRREDGYVLFEVEDTGVGIAEEELPRVFDRFFRSSDPRVQNETGTGLGLAMTQELVRLHGGTISVRSKLNQGTCFIVKLPV